jgi:hypothetical protein
VLEVDDLLVGKLFDEPAIERAVIGFDLSLGLRITRFDPIAAHSQKGQAGAEGLGVICPAGRGIELYPFGHAPLGGRQAKDPHGRRDVLGKGDDGGQDVAVPRDAGSRIDST